MGGWLLVVGCRKLHGQWGGAHGCDWKEVRHKRNEEKIMKKEEGAVAGGNRSTIVHMLQLEAVQLGGRK